MPILFILTKAQIIYPSIIIFIDKLLLQYMNDRNKQVFRRLVVSKLDQLRVSYPQRCWSKDGKLLEWDTLVSRIFSKPKVESSFWSSSDDETLTGVNIQTGILLDLTCDCSAYSDRLDALKPSPSWSRHFRNVFLKTFNRRSSSGSDSSGHLRHYRLWSSSSICNRFGAFSVGLSPPHNTCLGTGGHEKFLTE